MEFSSSRRKVERAAKHIRDLDELLNTFAKSDFYSVSIEEHKGSNHVRIGIDKSGFSTTDAALIIGDALHNLKSALDMLYYQAMHETTGATDHRTRFPIRNEREELVAAIEGGLKKKLLADDPSALRIRDVIVDGVKAYKAGNRPLWALHDLNIRDKHQLLVPIFDVMRFTDIRLEDEKEVFLADRQPYFMDDSSRFKIERRGRLTVKDKGHAAIAIVFNLGVPFEGDSVIHSLKKILESVAHAIDAFDALGLHSVLD
jgi:hypothetical protein